MHGHESPFTGGHAPRVPPASRLDGRQRDTASIGAWHVLRGTGLFDMAFERQNEDGWHLYQAGQRQFWAVEDAVDWREPFREDPEVARVAGAMLGFLCPGEKAAVTGAALISTRVRSEEAKLYFVEQAMEEAKHYEALRLLVPALTGRPFPAPSFWVRALYSYGVIDPDDLPFMMGNINVVGEHLANAIFRKVRPLVTDPKTVHLLALIGKDESRHIAAGERFFTPALKEMEGKTKKREAELMASAREKEAEMLKAAEKAAAAQKAEAEGKFYREAAVVVRMALAKTADMSPSAIDESLIGQALDAVKKLPK